MKTWAGKLLNGLSTAVLFSVNAAAATIYVDLNSATPTPPYSGWKTAAANIQDAIDAAVDGDQILVTNGVYQTGTGLAYDSFWGAMTNRVAVTKALAVQSVNGPAVTVIKGYQVPGTTNGPSAVRCVYLTNNATLIGFTLTNGATWRYAGGAAQTGGGVYCASVSATVSNCVLVGNAAIEGGGAGGGTLNNCVIEGNSAEFGGGAAEAVLNNCILTNNWASSAGGGSSYGFVTNCTLANNAAGNGGGAWGSVLVNCLLANNQAATNGGGVYYGSGFASSGARLINCTLKSNHAANMGGGAGYGCDLINCVLKQNSALYGGGTYYCDTWNCLVTSNTATVGGGADSSMMANCTVTANHASQYDGGVHVCTLMNCIVYYNSAPFAPDGSGSGNYGPGIYYSCLPLSGTITNEPLFVNQAGGDYHLQCNSPCINSGNNVYNTTSMDLDGNLRVVAGTMDLGAYEFQSPGSVLSYAWAQHYGLATDGSADFTDPDGDGLNSWQEWMAGTIPTDASSVLKMFSPTNRAAGGLRLSWQSVSGKSYFLQRATNLMTQPAFSSIGTNIVGQVGTTTISDTTATNGGPFFYRVGVQ
jgi:hypothetical protein